MVVGGGPAGLESARVVAIRGHRVVLYEMDNKLGGLINTLSKAPMREEFSQVTRFLTNQIQKLGVEVKLGTEVSLDIIRQEQPDTVIVTVGSRPYIEPIPGSDTTQVVNPLHVLNGEVNVGNKALIYECTGLQEGPTTADYLGEKGIKVELLTSQVSIGARWGMEIGILASHNPFIWQRLRGNGVNVITHSRIKEIAQDRVTLADVWTGEERMIHDVDTVIIATGYLPNNGLYKSLEGHVKELYAVGDCFVPRRALDAIHEAYLTAFYI